MCSSPCYITQHHVDAAAFPCQKNRKKREVEVEEGVSAKEKSVGHEEGV